MEDDTIKLPREYSAGLGMGIFSIDDSLDNVENGFLNLHRFFQTTLSEYFFIFLILACRDLDDNL